MPVHIPSDRSAPQIFLTPLKPAFIVGSAAAFAGFGFGAFRGVVSGRRPIVSALIVGGTWFGFGAFRGVVSGRRPIVSALIVGGTWFGFASVYWYSRLAMIKGFSTKPPTSKEKLLYSSAAGSLTGGINAALNRGPSFIWPSAVFFSGFGFIGQASYSQVEAWQQRTADQESAPSTQWLRGWNPFRSISEEEYESMLTEKLEQTKADIASLNKKIDEVQIAMNNSKEQSKG